MNEFCFLLTRCGSHISLKMFLAGGERSNWVTADGSDAHTLELQRVPIELRGHRDATTPVPWNVYSGGAPATPFSADGTASCRHSRSVLQG